MADLSSDWPGPYFMFPAARRVVSSLSYGSRPLLRGVDAARVNPPTVYAPLRQYHEKVAHI